ncbi:MAG: T9SS type A sorting domain-containing protein, partial [Patescibacteria group bacterium]|nr:T9SS type A sorting domain-containing protein [Patescibacteria group bacterium]
FSSIDLFVKFNSNYLQWRGLNTQGTLISGWFESPAMFDSVNSQVRIASASAYVSRIKPDAILAKLVFYVLAESAGSATDIEITKLNLERNDLYIVNDSVRVKVNTVPVTPINGRFVMMESKSKIYGSGDSFGFFPFGDESIVQVQFEQGNYSGKTVTVNNFGQSPPPGAFLSNKPVSVLQIQSDMPEGSFSSKLRVIYTENQLRNAGIKNEAALVLSRYNTQKGTWERYPTTVDSNSNIISATVDGFSYWAITDTSLSFKILSINDVGGDQGKVVQIRWTRADADRSEAPLPHITHYSVYRLAVNSAHDGKFGTDDWVEITSATARQDSVYTVSVPTVKDSTKTDGMQYSVFRIEAKTDNPLTTFNTPVDSGYSVDNLAPDIPKNFRIIEIAGGLVLYWDKPQETDAAYSSIYRGNIENFVRDGAHRMGTTSNQYFLDTTVVKGTTYYYQVTIVDSSGNAGLPTNSQRVTVTAVENVTEIPTAFSISQNYPNPFNLSTSIRVSIPHPATVDLRVYNLLGQEIRTLVNKSMTAGIHEIVWDGRNQSGAIAPSGIYIYKTKAGSFTAVKKMILLK